MVVLLAIAAISQPPPTVEVRESARMSVRIYRPTKITAEDWARDSNKKMRRETVIRGEDGRPIPIRLIEYE